MKNCVIAAISGMALMISGQVIAADIEAGKSKAAEVCASCHGLDGNTSTAPNFPKIGGQHRTYLEKALKDYKSGERKNPIMAGMTAALSEEDIDNLAYYYSSQSGSLTSKR
ncbi:MAG: cytochrome c [Nitrosomonas sp.]|jgi:cytochrome c553|nr:cytochrome c [Nitrosomonas sp.]